MSAFGTAKVQTNGVNLGFPIPFEDAYAQYGAPEQFQSSFMPSADIQGGDDFQSQYHSQKMRDAHYMSRAKVLSTRNMNARAFSSPNGYFNMPPPHLGQRLFANPSFGADGGYSARRDQASYEAPWGLGQQVMPPVQYFPPVQGGSMCHLTGGVLRTSAGQRHGIFTLNQRINQLNAIQEAKDMFLTGDTRPMTVASFAGAPSMGDELQTPTLVSMANSLQAIKDLLLSPNYDAKLGADVLKLSSQVFPQIVQLSIQNSPQDITNVLEFVQGSSAEGGILQMLKTLFEEYTEAYQGEESMASVLSILENQVAFWDRINDYLKQMIKISEQPFKTRKNASDAYLRSLGFNKIMRNSQALNANRLANVVPEDDFIDGDDRLHEPFTAQLGDRGRVGFSGAQINPRRRQQIIRREDSQHGYVGEGGQEFSENAQNAYAFGSGEFYSRSGGRPYAFMGEEPLADYGQQANERDVVRQQNEEAEGRAVEENEDLVAPPEEEARVSQGTNQFGDPDIMLSPLPAKREGMPKFGTPSPAKWKRTDVPYDREGLIKFIQKLNKEVPGYSQTWYNKKDGETKVANVRRVTIAKLEKLGLI